MIRLLTCLIILPSLLVAQDVRGPLARGMGGTGLTLSTPWSTFNNQASLAHIENFSVAASAARIYNIEQLNEMALGVSIPLKNTGTIGLSITNMGVSGWYQQRKFGLAMGRSFGNVFSAGIELNARNIFIENYGNTWLFSPEIGIMLRPESKISLAAHISNPFGTYINENMNERFPVVMRVGGSYSVNEQTKILLEASAFSNQKTKLQAGLLYTLSDKILLSTGFSTRDLSTSFGVQLIFSSVQVNLAFSYHQRLGSSPELGMAYVAQ